MGGALLGNRDTSYGPVALLWTAAPSALPISFRERGGDSGKPRHRFEIVERDRVAHVRFRRVRERLEIPGAGFAFAQRGVDEAAAALACAHFNIESGKIPAPRNFRPELGDAAGMVGARRQIIALP